MLDEGLGDHDFMLMKHEFGTIQYSVTQKVIFLQIRKVLLMSRKWMISANLPEHAIIIDRIQVLPVTPLVIHLFSIRCSLIGKLNI